MDGASREHPEPREAVPPGAIGEAKLKKEIECQLIAHGYAKFAKKDHICLNFSL